MFTSIVEISTSLVEISTKLVKISTIRLVEISTKWSVFLDGAVLLLWIVVAIYIYLGLNMDCLKLTISAGSVKDCFGLYVKKLTYIAVRPRYNAGRGRKNFEAKNRVIARSAL